MAEEKPVEKAAAKKGKEKKGKKIKKKKEKKLKAVLYKIDGEKIERLKRFCPKCGPGVFLAEHKDRFACGKCGFMEKK